MPAECKAPHHQRLAAVCREHCSVMNQPPGVCSNAVMELARGVRSQLEGLVAGLAGADLTPMSLGLSHSLSRYKLKFSPDKVRARTVLTGLSASLSPIAQSVQMMPCQVLTA